MKKIILFCIFLLSMVPSYTAVGRNNFTLNVGGSFNASVLTTGLGALGDLSFNSELKASGFYGGGFNVEMGYLALSQSAVTHALDLRFGVGMNFTEGSQASLSIQNVKLDGSRFNTFNASANAVYAIGSRMGKGRFLIDIFGAGAGYFTGDEIMGEDDNKKVFKGGNNFLFSAILPLGMQYVFDSGLMVGFRHRIDVAVAADTLFEATGSGELVPEGDGGRFGFNKNQTSYFAYNLTFSVGFAIGK